MKKHRILYISDWGDWGGGERVTLSLVTSLDRTQYEPCFILGSNGLLAQKLRSQNIHVIIMPMTPMSIPKSKRYLQYILLPIFFIRLAIYIIKCYLIARRMQPDLIQTCSIQAKIIGSFLAKLLNVKLIWHVQNMQPPGYRQHIVRFLAGRFPDMIVATSQAVADIYTGTIQVSKLQVNHAGIDLADFADVEQTLARKSLENELNLTDEKIVVSVSMISPVKGFHILIRAAVEVLKHNSDTKILIIGEPRFVKDHEYQEQLAGLVEQLGLAENVKFLGFREDVYNLIAAADCLVHCPVEYDSLPTVVLEAMALYTPVVGSRIGGIPEEIDDQISGLLVEPGDESGLAQAIIQILDDSDLAQSFAGAGRQKLETEFSHQLFVDKFEKTYAQVLA